MYPKSLLAFISAGQTSGRLQLTPSSRPLISERRGRTATRHLHKDNYVNGIIQGSIVRNGLNKFRLAVQWNAEISVPKLSGYQHAHDLFGAFVKLPHELHISLDHIDYSGRRKQRTVKQLSRSSLKVQLGQQAHLRLPQMNKSRFQNQQRQEVLKLLRRPAENRFRRPVVKRFRRTRLKRTAIPVNRNLPKRLQSRSRV